MNAPERVCCPNCYAHFDLNPIPPEPKPGSWVKDRNGGVHHRAPDGSGWGNPGFYYFGRWRDMWEARGPLVECEPYGGAS